MLSEHGHELHASLFHLLLDDSLAELLLEEMAIVLAHELDEVAVHSEDDKHLELFFVSGGANRFSVGWIGDVISAPLHKKRQEQRG